MEYEIVKSDELYHWGIKGMKWGVRRFQNKDGSLTPAGQKRRAKLESKLEKLGSSSKKSSGDYDSDSESAAPTKKKSVSEMSDDELNRAISRARLEDTYRQLRPEPKPVEKNAFGKQILNDVVKPAMINSGRKLLENSMNNVVEKLTKGKVDPDSLEALKKTYEKMDYKQKIDKMLNPDKYLSEEDKNKRQQRAFEAETREAQREGYQSVTDRAKAKREEAKKAADEKAARDRTARDAFVFKAKQDADASSRRQSSWEKTASNIKDEYDFSSTASTPVTSLSKSRVSRGKSAVDDYMDYSYSELLDRNGNVILSWGDD